VVVSREALASWISIPNIVNAVKLTRSKPPDSETCTNTFSLADVNSSTCLIPSSIAIPSNITCDHDHIDPQKVGSLKRITQVSYALWIFFAETSCDVRWLIARLYPGPTVNLSPA
jgi:hypothetical protein